MLKKLDTASIQHIELDMMKWLKDICDKNDIHMCLSGGTLLGAIRHNGFIPWDDDVDLMIPRPEYMKLMKILKHTHHPKYELRYINKSRRTFAKIVDVTTVIKDEENVTKGDKNIWIDIFPVDGLPNVKFFMYLEYIIVSLLRFGLFRIQDAHPFKACSPLKRTIANVSASIVCVFCRDELKLIKTIDKVSRSHPFDGSKYVGVVCFGHATKEIMPGKTWTEYVKVSFEGDEFYAPGCWKTYLESLYGDYMKLPPIEERQTHGIEAYIIEE